MLQTYDERNADIVYWCNGVLRHRDEPGISPFDSVAQGGDAVWEGLRVYDGRIFGLEPHLARLRCPTLVMCGDGDRLTPPECSREIAALMPHAELAWVPQCGHMLTMEKPELVNATLRHWLGQLNSSS